MVSLGDLINLIVFSSPRREMGLCVGEGRLPWLMSRWMFRAYHVKQLGTRNSMKSRGRDLSP